MPEHLCDLCELASPADAPCDGEASPGDLPAGSAVGVPASAGYLYTSLTSNLQSDSGEGCVAEYSFDCWDRAVRGGF